MSATTPDPATSPGGLRVGPYRLLARIGEGGMGVVHLAQGPDGRRVALKVLRPHVIGDEEARERLAREVASLRRIRSPRVAEVLDADPWGETPFVATRYVPGLSLHDHVRHEGPLTGGDLRHLAGTLAEALLAVHSVGVLHRDVKPSNVLLEGRSPVLIDFGLARLAEDPRLTITGWLLGTPGYLAPEILYGDDATTASDVHSWAATVAFAATGRPPYGRGPAMAVMDRVRRGEHDLSGVPDELVPVLSAALSPEPDNRPTLPTVLAGLRPAAPPPRAGHDQATMPFILDPRGRAGSDADTEVILPGPDTRVATVAAPVSAPLAAPLAAPVAPTALQPAAGAYPTAWRPPPRGVPRLQRGLLLTGLFALVSVGFAAAPYTALGLLALAALAVRSWSWTAQAARERTWQRGRRWYDGPLAAVTAPWYAVVATGGTVVLVLWAAALTFLVGVGLTLFRVPGDARLVLMGGALAFTAWWGPGARRLRVPTRGLLVRTTRSRLLGWATVAVVAAACVTTAYLFATSGTTWDPQPGPPWRHGTLLGDLVRLL